LEVTCTLLYYELVRLLSSSVDVDVKEESNDIDEVSVSGGGFKAEMVIRGYMVVNNAD
jgi:hypothetical protein